jgi:hypothetical protein
MLFIDTWFFAKLFLTVFKVPLSLQLAISRNVCKLCIWDHSQRGKCRHPRDQFKCSKTTVYNEKRDLQQNLVAGLTRIGAFIGKLN